MSKKTTTSRVRRYLTWVRNFMNLSASERKEIRSRVISALYRVSEFGEGSEDTRMGKELVEYLKTDFEFRGFTPALEYFKEASGKSEDALFVHPLSMPGLVYSHKVLPLIVITHPTLRWNKSVLHEMPVNREALEAILKAPIEEQQIIGATA